MSAMSGCSHSLNVARLNKSLTLHSTIGHDEVGIFTQRIQLKGYLSFFLWRFLRKRFLRLCVAILCLFLFLPDGIVYGFFI